MVGAKLANMGSGNYQNRKLADLPTQTKAAELLKVSERSVKTAKKVEQNATPEISQYYLFVLIFICTRSDPIKQTLSGLIKTNDQYF